MSQVRPQEIFDAVFAILVDAAARGARCPTSDNIAYCLEKRGFTHGGTGIVPDLAEVGRIKIEVYSLNWRVVEICEGEHKGERTAECPRGGKPYIILDRTGRHETGVRGRMRDAIHAKAQRLARVRR